MTMSARPLVVLAALFAVSFGAVRAEARSTMTVSPARIELKAAPGGSSSQRVYYFNDGTGPLMVRAEVWDWRLDAKGTRVFMPPGIDPNSVIPWFTVTPREQPVGPGESVGFAVTASVPLSATGSRGAMLFLGTVAPGISSAGVGVGIAARLGVQVLVDTGTAEPGLSAEIVDIQPPTKATPLLATVSVRNSGQAYAWIDTTLEIVGPLDDFVGHLTHKDRRTLLLPGEEKRFDFDWAGELAPAIYSVIATVSCHPRGLVIAEGQVEVGPAPDLRAGPVGVSETIISPAVGSQAPASAAKSDSRPTAGPHVSADPQLKGDLQLNPHVTKMLNSDAVAPKPLPSTGDGGP